MADEGLDFAARGAEFEGYWGVEEDGEVGYVGPEFGGKAVVEGCWGLEGWVSWEFEGGGGGAYGWFWHCCCGRVGRCTIQTWKADDDEVLYACFMHPRKWRRSLNQIKG